MAPPRNRRNHDRARPRLPPRNWPIGAAPLPISWRIPSMPWTIGLDGPQQLQVAPASGRPTWPPHLMNAWSPSAPAKMPTLRLADDLLFIALRPVRRALLTSIPSSRSAAAHRPAIAVPSHSSNIRRHQATSSSRRSKTYLAFRRYVCIEHCRSCAPASPSLVRRARRTGTRGPPHPRLAGTCTGLGHLLVPPHVAHPPSSSPATLLRWYTTTFFTLDTSSSSSTIAS